MPWAAVKWADDRATIKASHSVSGIPKLVIYKLDTSLGKFVKVSDSGREEVSNIDGPVNDLYQSWMDSAAIASDPVEDEIGNMSSDASWALMTPFLAMGACQVACSLTFMLIVQAYFQEPL